MKMTDEMLSAFLDNELTDAEMAAVRDQLAADLALTDRLAELATVDAELQAHYGSIDDRPMPESVTRMLGHESTGNASPEEHPQEHNVVTFPWWRTVRGHAGKAVAAAVIGGFALTQWFGLPPNGGASWQTVAQALDSQPSGEVYAMDQQATLTPRLTFRNQAGHWCRQFRLESEAAASEQIACRGEAGGWEQIARVNAEPLPESSRYQAASGGSVLDEQLDQIMAGSPIGADKERELLERQWGD